jgi:hypothetical protein
MSEKTKEVAAGETALELKRLFLSAHGATGLELGRNNYPLFSNLADFVGRFRVPELTAVVQEWSAAARA